MPLTINDLTEQQKATLPLVLNKLREIKEQALHFNEELIRYQTTLGDASSEGVFFDVINQIDKTAREVSVVFNSVMKDLDPAMIAVVNETVRHDPSLLPAWKVAFFDNSLKESIVATKERLKENALYRQLPDEDQRDKAKSFIDSIRTLKPMAEELNEQKEAFKHRLAACQTADDVNFIEMEIEERNGLAQEIYQHHVSFSENEHLNGILIEFLKANPHLLELMNTFAFHDSLVGDVLEARNKVASSKPFSL